MQIIDDLKTVLNLIAEGYPVEVFEDRIIRVENPDFEGNQDWAPDPYFVVDVFTVNHVLNQLRPDNETANKLQSQVEAILADDREQALAISTPTITPVTEGGFIITVGEGLHAVDLSGEDEPTSC